MNFRSVIFFLVLLFSSSFLFSQTVPDSFDPGILDSSLKNAQSDSVRYEIYLRLGEAFRISQPEKAKEYYQKIIEGREVRKYANLQAKAYIMMTMLAQANAELDSMLYFSSLATDKAKKGGDTTLIIKCMINEANALVALNRRFEGAEILSKTITYSRLNNDSMNLCNSLLFLANLHIRNNQHLKAIELIQNDSSIWQATNKYLRATFQYVLGNAFASMKKFKQANKLYQKVYPVFKESNDPYNLVQLLNNFSTSCVYLGQLDSALTYNHESLKILKNTKDTRSLGYAYFSRAKIFHSKEMLDSAAVFASKASRLLVKVKDPGSYIPTLKLLSDIEAERGNWKESKLLSDRLITVMDSISYEARLESVDSLLILHDVKEKETALRAAEQENLIQQLQWERTWIGIVSLSFIGVTLLIVFIYRKRLQLKLLASERDQKENELILARKELKFKLEEVSYYQGSVKNLEEKLKSLKSKQQNKEEILKSADIFNILNRNIKEDADWGLFEGYFENSNPYFFSSLKKKYPGLTAHDMRLAALLKLNLSSSEIAILFNIATESVSKARYRLAKKLLLDGERDLYPFILNHRT